MRRNRPARRPRPSTPPMPAHVVAFMNQVDADVRAGVLLHGVAVHFDVVTLAGAAFDIRPRVCSAPVDVDCSGGCA